MDRLSFTSKEKNSIPAPRQGDIVSDDDDYSSSGKSVTVEDVITESVNHVY